MAIEIQELEGGITKVILTGRLDVAGSREIDVPLGNLAGAKSAVVVDLSRVELMTSLGLRSIVLAGKAIMSKGGKMVMLSPRPIVAEVITTSGVDELIPVYHDERLAIAAVSPAPG